MLTKTILASLFIASFTLWPTSAKHEFELDGSAVKLGKECIRLTPNEWRTKGAAWAKTALDLDKSFDLKMDLKFGDNDELGADGIVFVLTP